MVRHTPKRGAGGSNPLWDAKSTAVCRQNGIQRCFFLHGGILAKRLYGMGVPNEIEIKGG